MKSSNKARSKVVTFENLIADTEDNDEKLIVSVPSVKEGNSLVSFSDDYTMSTASRLSWLRSKDPNIVWNKVFTDLFFLCDLQNDLCGRDDSTIFSGSTISSKSVESSETDRIVRHRQNTLQSRRATRQEIGDALLSGERLEYDLRQALVVPTKREGVASDSGESSNSSNDTVVIFKTLEDILINPHARKETRQDRSSPSHNRLMSDTDAKSRMSVHSQNQEQVLVDAVKLDAMKRQLSLLRKNVVHLEEKVTKESIKANITPEAEKKEINAEKIEKQKQTKHMIVTSGLRHKGLSLNKLKFSKSKKS